jgi:hypothetical protein
VLVGVAALVWKPALATLLAGNRPTLLGKILKSKTAVRPLGRSSATASDITAGARKAKRNPDCFYFN